MKLAFASNSSFGTIIFEKLLKERAHISFLITSPNKRIGRGKRRKPLPIKEIAEKNKIPVKEAGNKDEFHKVIESDKPDLVVMAGFGLIITTKTLEMSQFINVHPSLLPKYRGPTPIQSAIMEGEKMNGVTIIEVTEGIDEGPILKQEEVCLPEKITYPEAEKVLAKKGGELLLKLLSYFEKNGKDFKRLPQNEKFATYTRMLEKKDGRINWKESAGIIEKKVRALNPWPGTHTTLNGKTIKILDVETQEQTSDGPFGEPGKIYLGTNDTLAVQTGKDFLIIKKLQIEGKKPSTSKDFLQGNMDFIGKSFS